MDRRIVYIIDGNPEDRRTLAGLLGEHGRSAWPFSDHGEFLTSLPLLRPGCIVLALGDPPSWGLTALADLRRRQVEWPLIMVGACDDIGTAVAAMKHGAWDFLQSPLDADTLNTALDLAESALERLLPETEGRRQAQMRLSTLTSRETDIALALLGGLPNKVIAYQLGISVRTVEAHRANIMVKLGVKSLAEMLLLMTQAGLESGITLKDGKDGRQSATERDRASALRYLQQRASDSHFRNAHAKIY